MQSVEPINPVGLAPDELPPRAVVAPATIGRLVECAVVLDDAGLVACSMTPRQHKNSSATTRHRRRSRHRRSSRSSWLCLVEHILGDWAPTLRLAVLLTIILAALVATVAVSFGLASALLLLGGSGTIMKMLTGRQIEAVPA